MNKNPFFSGGPKEIIRTSAAARYNIESVDELDFSAKLSEVKLLQRS